MSEFSISDYDYLLVIDFEATCVKKGNLNKFPGFRQEIIEFPIILVDVEEKRILEKQSFMSFCRPTENTKLTQFCKNLTKISQKNVDKAPKLLQVLKDVREWMVDMELIDEKNNTPRCKFVFLSDGWDFSQLREECKRKNIKIPTFLSEKYCYKIKDVAEKYLGKRPVSLNKMLEMAALEFEGIRHRGFDDAKNMARVLINILKIMKM